MTPVRFEVVVTLCRRSVASLVIGPLERYRQTTDPTLDLSQILDTGQRRVSTFSRRSRRASLCRSGVLLRFVDPYGGGQRGWFGRLADEAFAVRGVGGVEDVGTLVAHEHGSSVVDVGRVWKPMPEAYEGP